MITENSLTLQKETVLQIQESKIEPKKQFQIELNYDISKIINMAKSANKQIITTNKLLELWGEKNESKNKRT